MLIGGRSLNGVFNLAAMTIIVRSAGLETFGMLVVIHAVMSTVEDVVKFQSWQSVLRYGAPALEEGRTLDFRRLIKLTVLLDLGSSIVGIIGAVIAIPLIASRFDWTPELVPLIQLYTLSILFMVTATPTGLLRLFDRFDLLSVENAIGSLVRVVGAIGFYFFGGGLEILLLIWFASTVASGLWLIINSIRVLSARGMLDGPRLGYRGLATGHEGIASFVWKTQANTTLSASTRNMPVLVVGLLLSSVDAGLYNIGRQVTTLLTRFAKLMKPAIYPEFARLSAQDDMLAIRQLMLRSIALMSGAGAVIMLPLILFGRPLLGLIFGHEVEAAYGLVVVLALAAAVRLLAFPLEPALISTGRAGVALLVRTVTVLIFLVLLFTLIPTIGLIGAGVAGLAAALCSVVGQSMAVVAWFKSRAEASRLAAGSIATMGLEGERPTS